MTAVRHEQAPGRSAAESSPLDVMLTDAALGPVRRMVPGRAGLELWGRMASRPVDTSKLWLRTTAELAKVAVGRSEVESSPRDKRFADPAWKGNPVLHRLCQAYLVGGSALEHVVDDADLDWRSEQQLRFAVKAAPRAVGSAQHERIGKAPGAYVMEP